MIIIMIVWIKLILKKMKMTLKNNILIIIKLFLKNILYYEKEWFNNRIILFFSW